MKLVVRGWWVGLDGAGWYMYCPQNLWTGYKEWVGSVIVDSMSSSSWGVSCTTVVKKKKNEIELMVKIRIFVFMVRDIESTTLTLVVVFGYDNETLKKA